MMQRSFTYIIPVLCFLNSLASHAQGFFIGISMPFTGLSSRGNYELSNVEKLELVTDVAAAGTTENISRKQTPKCPFSSAEVEALESNIEPFSENSNISNTTIISTGDESHNNKKAKMPWWWHTFWYIGRKLRITKRGQDGQDIRFGDTAFIARTNIEQIYGGGPSLDGGCPIATGEIDDIGDGTRFVGLLNYTAKYGSPYKLCFGPARSFLVFGDPIQIKHLLKEAHTKYDKGLLAEILKPIMGDGLMPVSDPKVWNERRRAIVPAFHKAWIEYMVGLFGYSTQPLLSKLEATAMESSLATVSSSSSCEMENLFCSAALDIMGKSMFNYDFGSITKESPFIKAVCSSLMEAEHRAQTLVPYWNIPLANRVVPRLRRFRRNLRIIHEVMDELISNAKQTRTVSDIEELQNKNYDKVQDPSMLRFMVDMRGANIDDKQLRDDFITMLVSGHETVAAVLTWTLFELVKHPKLMTRVQNEIDSVLGNDPTSIPTYNDIKKMEYVRLVVAETLRLYPEPPLLIRRCRTPDIVPKGGGARQATVLRGMDVFMATHSLHRDARYWEDPNTFNPDRFLKAYHNPSIPEWKGYDPERWRHKSLYPDEVASDFAFVPFGGGARRCIGDEFAMLEIVVTLTMVLRQFDFEFDPSNLSPSCDICEPPQRVDHPVGMHTGATIHTRHGLHMIVKKRAKQV
mmetsp:Transcript_12918/g.27429  ORF Transcript_12918/g.27429 Transcript_12918/m.27429 type:complete len:688 (+) Transcript_12918:153-2216(+)